MKNIKIIFIIFMVSILLFGCMKNENPTEFKKKDKAPESLANLTKGIDEILVSVGEIERINLNIQGKKKEEDKEETKQQGDQSATQGKGQEQGQDQGQEGGQGQGQGQGQEQGQDQQQMPTAEKKQADLKKQWDKIQSTLEETHKNWNDYEAEGLKKGATKEQFDKFKDAFNKMTAGVENKNIAEIYDYASQSYLNLKPLYDLYTDEFRGDISILKYAAYKAYISAVLGDMEKAEEVLNGREENINKIRMKIENEEEKSKVDNLSISLMNFKDALKEDSRILYMIKKDVIIESINEIKD